MGFNNTTDEEVQQKAKEQKEKKKEKLEGGEQKERHNFKVDDGNNVVWPMPGKGDTVDPVNDFLLHFNPFHACGRTHPMPSDEDGKDYEQDKNFDHCFRCKAAWNKWDSLDQADFAKPKFMDDMPNHRALVQVVDLTPFFEEDGVLLQPDEDRINEWFETYKDLVKQDEIEDEGVEDVPDDIVKAARESPSITFVNPDVGESIRLEHLKKKARMDDDPNVYPNKALLSIKRSKKDDTFTGKNGNQIHKRKYDIDYIDVEGFDVDFKELGLAPGEDFFSYLEGEAVDMHNIEPDDDTLEAKARALRDLTDDEMEEYLDGQGHSFNPESNTEDGLDPDNVPSEGEADEVEVDEEELQDPEALASDADLSKLDEERE